MNYKEYTVKIYSDGTKEWWLDDKRLTEEEFNQRTKLSDCDGKVVEIGGKKYKLTEI